MIKILLFIGLISTVYLHWLAEDDDFDDLFGTSPEEEELLK